MNLNPFKRNKVEKVLADMNQTLQTQDGLIGRGEVPNGRGLMVYSMSQLMAITGRAQDGRHLTMNFDQSIFYLNFDERVSIYRLCAPVNSVVTSRMNLISSIEFDVVSDKKDEERIAHRLKLINGIREDYAQSSDLPSTVAAKLFEKEIKDQLTPYGLLPDLSNFDKAMLRWHRAIQQQNVQEGHKIKEWLMEPNMSDRWGEHVKKIVFDLMIHGATAIYKEVKDGRLENFYTLPGGTVIPLKNKYAGGLQAYFQQTNNVDEPLIYFDNELAYANYLPNTSRAYSFVPLEALINMVAESMLFDRLMGDQADGTKPPEKMVVIANNSPFGEFNKETDNLIPIDQAEQKRIEQKLSSPRKNAIMTFTGNTVQVVDLSRENTMEFQHQRQKDITNYVGMVFQASPMEMNLSGGENTSGRSTADAQQDIYRSKGVLPILQIIESLHNRNIIPFRYGPGWKIDYKTMKNDAEEMELLQKKMATNLFSVNEVRKNDLNIEPFPDKQYDVPPGAGSQTPDGSAASPINFKGV